MSLHRVDSELFDYEIREIGRLERILSFLARIVEFSIVGSNLKLVIVLGRIDNLRMLGRRLGFINELK